MTKFKWIALSIGIVFLFALFGGQCIEYGKRAKLRELENPKITQYGSKRYDPNTDPMYKSLIDQGYRWDGKWTKN